MLASFIIFVFVISVGGDLISLDLDKGIETPTTITTLIIKQLQNTQTIQLLVTLLF